MKNETDDNVKTTSDEEFGLNLLNLMEDPISVVDPEMKYLFVNAKACQLLNADSKEIVGKTVFQCFPDYEAIPMAGSLNQVFNSGESLSMERRFVFSGRTLWLDTQLIPVKNASGKVEKVISISRDITDRKLAEQAQFESEQRFKFLAENMADIVWTLNMDLKTTYVSPSIKKILGFTPEERKQQTLEQMITPESLQHVMTVFEEELQKDEEDGIDRDRSITIETEYYHVQGHTVWMENSVKAIRNQDGEIAGMYGASRDITGRKQAEEALLLSEKKFRQIFENVLTPYYEASLEGILLDVNPSVEKYLQYSRTELIGKPIMDLYADPDQRERFLKKLIEKGELVDEEILIRDKDGTILNALLSAKYIQQDQKIVGSLLDITERKKAENALVDSEELFRTTINAMNEGLVVTDIDFKPIFVNPKLFEVTGYDERDLSNLNIERFYTEESQSKLMEAFTENMETGKASALEVQVVKKDGKIADFLLSGNLIVKNGEFQKAVATFTDISDIKQKEKNLRKLSRAVEQSPVSVIITDVSGTIEYVNPKFESLTGYKLEETIGLTPSVLKSGEHPDELYKDLWETISSGVEWRGILHNKKKNGELYWESAVIAPVMDNDGKIINYVAVKQDITQQRQVEEERDQMIIQLQDALETVKKLSGLLPICANCKKIRDDKGYWNQIESYIEKHSEAQFSHGMCQECAEELYGDSAWYRNLKNKKP